MSCFLTRKFVDEEVATKRANEQMDIFEETKDYTVMSGQLNVVKELKRTNQIDEVDGC
jgi:hypothetical protein